MKIVVILSRIPYPLEKGDKLRAYHQIKYLAKTHQVILIALNDSIENKEAVDHLKQFCYEVHVFKLPKISIVFNLLKSFFTKLPFQVAYFYNASVHKKIDAIIENEQPDRIFTQLIRTSEYVKEQYQIIKTIDYMDAFSKGIERRMQKENWFMNILLNVELQRLLKYENKIFDFFEHHCIISEQDRDFIPHIQNQKIEVIKNGVDFDFYVPKNSIKKFDILFSGHLNYPPNIVSVQFLVNDVFPLLKQKNASISILIAGAEPSEEIIKLKKDGVEIIGWVDDIRTCYYESKLFVAPMKISIGLQNKLLQALSMKIPCITTPLANNALGAKNNDEIILAESAEQFSESILTILQNQDKYNQLAENGYHFVKANYAWNTMNLALEQLIVKEN